MSEASDSAAIPQDIQQLMASVAKSEGRLAPYGVSEHLAPRIEELSLVEPLAHFQEYGYAVIEDVAPPEDMDALREVIHRIADAIAGPGKGELAPYLLGLDPAIDRGAADIEQLLGLRDGHEVGIVGPTRQFFGQSEYSWR